jgi:hypothetical protein
MRAFGFSTGALAKGNVQRGLELLQGAHADAVELSALREDELPLLMEALADLELGAFREISVHAPGRFSTLAEADAARLLLPCLDRGFRVVLHPDAIVDPGCWRDFGSLLCIENMDKRKSTGRTAVELRQFFAELPQASLCLDLAHARQFDTTLGVARSILGEFGERVAQIHLSELDARSHHVPLSMAAVDSIQTLNHWIPPVPVILESEVPKAGISEELALARRCFERDPKSARNVGDPRPTLTRA